MTRIPANGSGTPIVRVLLAFLFLSGVAYSQNVSYWFQGWQTKPNAQQAQAYFMLPGTNISFTYSNNRVIINGTGTNAGPSGTSCCQIVTFATNSLFSTNWTGSNSMWTNIVGSFQPLCPNLFEWCGVGTNDFFLSVTQYVRGATNNIIAGSNALWCDNLTNWCTVTPADITNLVSNATNTLSTNLMTFVTNYVAGATNISGATGLVTNEFTTNLTVTISQFQPACGNLSNWCLLPTNVIGTGTSGLVTNEFTTNISVTISQFQPACANLSNWCLISPLDITNTITNAVFYGTNIVSSNLFTFITNYVQGATNALGGSNALWCDNLTNWCTVTPEGITNAITNAVYWGTNTTSSNILVTVSNSIYTTSNAIISIGTPNVVFNNAGTTNYAGFGARGGTTGAGSANTAVGYQADAEGNTFGGGTAIGYQAHGHDVGVAVGYLSDGSLTGVAVGASSSGSADGVAVGYSAAAGPSGVAVGRQANGAAQGVAIGKQASGANDGVGVGYFADGSSTGVAVGQFAFAEGIGNVAIGGSDTGPNKAQVTAGWGDSIELGRGSAAINGGLSFRGMGIIDSSANIFSSTISPTNGVIQQTYKTNGTLICVTNKQFYLVYGTNQLITLPDASLGTVSNIIYRFSSTNGYGSFIVTNATGTQRIRDGVSLSYTNIGINEVGFISDGANWWLASKGKQIFPSASWSLSSNITLAQDTITNLPFSDLEFNNSQGIALKTNATFSRPTQLWVTNSGTYMITFSAVLRGPAGGGTISLWLRKGGTDVPRTRTDQIFAGTTSQTTMTVNFFQNVGAPDFFELVAASHNATPPTIEASAANPTGYTAPAMPSIIVTINRVSDTWP